MADFNTLTKEQAEANRLFATANIGLNRVDSYDPAGSITWSLRPGADPSNPQVGDYVQRTTLNPSQQAQFDSRNDIQQKLLALAQSRLGEFASTFGQPLDTSGLRAFGAPIRTGSRLNPQPQVVPRGPASYSAVPMPMAATAPITAGAVRQPMDPSTYRAPPVVPVASAGPSTQAPAYSAIGNLGGAGYGGSSGSGAGLGSMGFNGAFGNAVGFNGKDAAAGGLKGLATRGPIGGIVGLLNGFNVNRGVFSGNLDADTAAAYNSANAPTNEQNIQAVLDAIEADGGGSGFGYGAGWGNAGDGGLGLSSGGVGGGGYADGSGPGFDGRGRGRGGGGYGMGGGGGGYGGFGGGYGNGGGGM